ncbi:DsbE family thiol:disulfide interchange protein [Ruixingdingia sedimenti]|uniref:DsbE family thiol:disulfide interchange protein n=1 Tax=Ruixingdingia sedimenti TaxID=3073604 RepID=A0ABU1F3Z0_9RHOB|nr:DsbE family thiol:disulfide interchange protein [Xinfangfangia sp. LG-4]MDR5651358.1 DsbE family thiol:disulfide interchange protein [Xinfangfangia sp. LG-4]
MARGKWLLFIPPAVFGLLAGLFFAGMYRDDPEGLPSTLVGRAAPPMALTQLGDGVLPDDAALRAPGVKLVNFWASWCAPCRAEHPMLTELAGEGVPIIGVNYKDQPDNALKFLAELGDPYAAIGADAQGRVALSWGVYGVPETYVIDGAGKVLLRIAGPVSRAVLEDTLRPAITAVQPGAQ